MTKRMMIRERQRGAIDLMQAAVAFLMITVAVVGTTYAMFFGRQALIQQEHRKVALYQLRQYVEHWTGRIALSDITAQDLLGGPQTAFAVDLDDASVPEDVKVRALITRGPTETVDLSETGTGIDYYRIHLYATWQERDGCPQRIDIKTSMLRVME
ncbi:MAG: hypothetical protein V1784_11750 [bacterium]